MEPVEIVAVVSPVIKAAWQATAKKLEAAEKLEADDTRRYIGLLEAAETAVLGLENEYLGILVEAKRCATDSPERLPELRERIDQYLHGEVLRPQLVASLTRLEQGRQTLEQHAEGIDVQATA